jgi:ketosteroid isomerase-like protein
MAGEQLDEQRARNLDVVRAAWAGIEASDAAQMLANYTDDMVLELPYGAPPKRIEGRDAALEYLSGGLGAFELHLTIDAVHPMLDPDALVIEFSGTGSFRPTGAAYENRYIALYRFRDGLICEQREYYNPSASPTGGRAVTDAES